MIFLHSSFRTASTHLWSVLRASSRTVAYYEIFNEQLATITRELIMAGTPDTWYSKHPPGAPYFLEFLPLLQEGGGVQGFEPAMSYERFIPPDGPGGAVNAAEMAYVTRLIGTAEGDGKIPVLTATRSLGRFVGFKAAVPGLHVLVYRNLFQQWCSFTEQALRGNLFFLDRIIAIARLNGHDPTVAELLLLFPASAASVDSTDLFFLFVFLHLHLYVHAAGAADLIVDVNRLADDPSYRTGVEARFATQGLAVDLSGTRNSIAYSLCRFGSTAELTQRLDVIGDMVIGRAPTEAGRLFGIQVIADLIGEFHRHEFHAAALRAELERSMAECRALRDDRDAIEAELRHLHAERDTPRDGAGPASATAPEPITPPRLKRRKREARSGRA